MRPSLLLDALNSDGRRDYRDARRLLNNEICEGYETAHAAAAPGPLQSRRADKQCAIRWFTVRMRFARLAGFAQHATCRTRRAGGWLRKPPLRGDFKAISKRFKAAL
ncbi:hypothetical protein [Burkholderia sp. ABCPW 111]|uniref:hypothetical protein n=1 Tax=Burkholderia sp. ABCPW 111 TaxID=1820025 RepID=UPI001F3E54C4|nr:hypothetical protein [Burkholderia sp. ABCPW 111]